MGFQWCSAQIPTRSQVTPRPGSKVYISIGNKKNVSEDSVDHTL